MQISFAEWRPDQDKLNSDFATYINNVLCAAGHYIPMPQCVAISSALPAAPLSAFTAVDDGGTVHVFAGTAQYLFKLDISDYTWSHVSKLGADIVTNGAFTTDVSWTKGTGVDINSTTATKCHFGSVADGVGVSQSQATANDTIYKVTFTISNHSAGGVHAAFTGGTAVEGTSRTANGTYTEYLTASGTNTAIGLFADGTTTLDIDDFSIEPLTTYGASTSARWAWKQFGLVVLALNAEDAPQAFTLGSSPEFDDLAGSPPQAGGAAISGDYVILFRIKNAPRKIQWCDTDDITDWTSSGNGGSQTFPDGGDVMGVSDATNPIIVQEKAIRMGQYSPGGGIFQFTKVYDNRGCAAPYSFCQRSENIFFADSGGFFQIDAAGQLLPIGYEKIDRHIFENVSATAIANIIGSVDPFYSRAYFLLQVDATGDEYDLMLTYDWQLQRWSRASVSLYCIMPAASLGYTLAGLDVFGTISQLPAPFGSKVWQGGAPIMGGFDTDNKLCYFNGDAAEATLRTAEYGDPTGQVQFIRSVLPIADTSSAYVRLGARMLRGSDVVWTGEQPVSTAHGRVHIRSRARFHRAEMRIPAGVDWMTAQGLDVEAQAAGTR